MNADQPLQVSHKEPSDAHSKQRTSWDRAVKALDDVHAAQYVNYLKATGLTVCLVMNFGKPRVEIKRFVNRY